MTLKDLESTVAGRVEGSTIEVIALRGDADAGQLEIAEGRDGSLALGAIPANPARRMVPAAQFRPWPQSSVYIGGQPFVYQWVGGGARCARCGAELEHFAYVGRSGGDVREREQGAVRLISYCASCARNPL
ncbi:MAG: hypothetical protein WB808_11070 [Candidatus Dormiibacterota bacterium]